MPPPLLYFFVAFLWEDLAALVPVGGKLNSIVDVVALQTKQQLVQLTSSPGQCRDAPISPL